MARTEVATFGNMAWSASSNDELGSYGSEFTVCLAEEVVGGALKLVHAGEACVETSYIDFGEEWTMLNPSIKFSVEDAQTTQTFDSDGDVVLEPVAATLGDSFYVQAFNTKACSETVGRVGRSFMGIVRNGTTTAEVDYYVHDPRQALFANTPESPADPSSYAEGRACPAAPMTSSNQDTCTRKPSNTCAPLKLLPGAGITLNDATLAEWHTRSEKYLYSVTGLRLDHTTPSPCKAKHQSRWTRVSGNCETETGLAVDAATEASIKAALSGAADATDPSTINIRDIIVRTAIGQRTCSVDYHTNPSLPQFGAQVETGDGSCWQHSHADERNVYDFTRWMISHPGTRQNPAFAVGPDTSNPIKQFRARGEAELQFPDHHPMNRWSAYTGTSRFYFTFVGRAGQIVEYAELPPIVQTAAMAAFAGASTEEGTSVGVDACGSRGEVANDPSLGNHYGALSFKQNQGIDHPYQLGEALGIFYTHQKSYLWQNVVLTADDQLRQRVAWALSQILVVGETAERFKAQTEAQAAFYDIFVHNAFGNFGDVMKEVSANAEMSHYLTFMGNRAFANGGNFPDENYSRELMQLFSIGLWELNQDGTYKVDGSGSRMKTYTNYDIMAFAKVWTGYVRPEQANIRGNLHAPFYDQFSVENYVDPLKIEPEYRDKTPKTSLRGGYIGDGYPMCSDFQEQHFLKRGAQYKFSGLQSVLGPAFDDTTSANKRAHFSPLAGESGLWKALCAKDESSAGKCTFPSNVVLLDDLVCNGKVECNAPTLRAIKIVDTTSVPGTTTTVYYEYVSPPCVQLTFFDGGRAIQQGKTKQCANPDVVGIAGVGCCSKSTGDLLTAGGDDQCLYIAEATSFRTAEDRCAATFGDDGKVCPSNKLINPGSDQSWKAGCGGFQFNWIDSSCSLQVQVDQVGHVNVIDKTASYREDLQLNSGNPFPVRWSQPTSFAASSVQVFPVIPDEQKGGTAVKCLAGCENIAADSGLQSCRCSIAVDVTAKYTDPTAKLPSVADLRANLFIAAAVNPSTSSSYTKCETSTCTSQEGVAVYTKSNNGGSNAPTAFDEHTIFELTRAPVGKYGSKQSRFLLNKISTVFVGSRSTGFNFRNSPQFMSNVGELPSLKDQRWLDQEGPFGHPGRLTRQAEAETEALVNHLHEHDNTAPFIAYRLIQRLTTSNPSGRYIKAVSHAFATGSYKEMQFSGKYGDLGATIAAVMLDREATHSVLNADPTHGMLREPLLKVLHMMRSMEFKTDGHEVMLFGMEEKVGQNAFQSPSVFNYYLPEFAPEGRASAMGLAVPEAQIALGPYIIGYLSGMDGLIDAGLNGGFGRAKCKSYIESKACANARGLLTYQPSTPSKAGAVVDELANLLTLGRLSSQTRTTLVDAYEFVLASNSSDSSSPQSEKEKEALALKQTLKLFAMAPEFHATNTHTLGATPTVRKQPEAIVSLNRTYKAVVVVFLEGGADSYNMVVPHSNCKGADLYDDYVLLRTKRMALKKSELLQVEVNATLQPCGTFGLHPSLNIVHDLYKKSEAALIANAGVLIEPVNKMEVLTMSKPVPPSLFAHNVMQQAARTVHAEDNTAKGILGKLVDAITANVAEPMKSALYTTANYDAMVEGSKTTKPHTIDKKNGAVRYKGFAQMESSIDRLAGMDSESLFADIWNQKMAAAVKAPEILGPKLKKTTLKLGSGNFADDQVSSQLHQIAKLIAVDVADDTKMERSAFVTKIKGWDTHGDMSLTSRLDEVNAGLTSFYNEMVAQGLWNDVAVLCISDFGRTLTSNTRGTDHGWGGNYFVLGGDVQGGQMLGTFPERLVETPAGSNLNIGRGRYIPTTPWESIWQGVGEWWGVGKEKLAEIMPHAKAFIDEAEGKDALFGNNKLFK